MPARSRGARHRRSPRHRASFAGHEASPVRHCRTGLSPRRSRLPGTWTPVSPSPLRTASRIQGSSASCPASRARPSIARRSDPARSPSMRAAWRRTTVDGSSVRTSRAFVETSFAVAGSVRGGADRLRPESRLRVVEGPFQDPGIQRPEPGERPEGVEPGERARGGPVQRDEERDRGRSARSSSRRWAVSRHQPTGCSRHRTSSSRLALLRRGCLSSAAFAFVSRIRQIRPRSDHRRNSTFDRRAAGTKSGCSTISRYMSTT